MGPGDERIVPADLELSYNVVTSLWFVEVKTYRPICDIWSWITVKVKVKLMLRLIELFKEQEKQEKSRLISLWKSWLECSLFVFFVGHTDRQTDIQTKFQFIDPARDWLKRKPLFSYL